MPKKIQFRQCLAETKIQYPQNVKAVGDCLEVPKIGIVKAVFHRAIEGKIKTVTITKSPTDKYFASILCEVESGANQPIGDKTLGIDLGLKDFAIVHDGNEVTKHSKTLLLLRHEKNLARKQKKFARKVIRLRFENGEGGIRTLVKFP